MKITFDPDLYDFSDGRFIAKFMGVSTYSNDKARGKDGQFMPPGLRWRFLISSGPDSGKEISKITPALPTLKNGCGRMLMELTERDLTDACEVDTDNYVGGYYHISIRESRIQDAPAMRFIGKKISDSTPGADAALPGYDPDLSKISSPPGKREPF